jgi:murein L,D-transpeptidase YcbB/YkuD
MDFGLALLAADHAKRGAAFDAERARHLGGPKPWPFHLEQQVPVFFEYYTASVDEDGAVWFHPDVYGYDAETWALEASKPPR